MTSSVVEDTLRSKDLMREIALRQKCQVVGAACAGHQDFSRTGSRSLRAMLIWRLVLELLLETEHLLYWSAVEALMLPSCSHPVTPRHEELASQHRDDDCDRT